MNRLSQTQSAVFIISHEQTQSNPVRCFHYLSWTDSVKPSPLFSLSLIYLSWTDSVKPSPLFSLSLMNRLSPTQSAVFIISHEQTQSNPVRCFHYLTWTDSVKPTPLFSLSLINRQSNPVRCFHYLTWTDSVKPSPLFSLSLMNRLSQTQSAVLQLCMFSIFPILFIRWAASLMTKPTKWLRANKMTGRTAKTQISLGIRPVWSESSLCAHWVTKDPSILHADSEDSDQPGRLGGCPGWSES